MPQAQLVDVVEKIRITKSMPTPKKITDLAAWYRGARKVIPEIPDVNRGEWQIFWQEAYLEYIRFELHNNLGQKRHLVIIRSHSSITGK